MFLRHVDTNDQRAAVTMKHYWRNRQRTPARRDDRSWILEFTGRVLWTVLSTLLLWSNTIAQGADWPMRGGNQNRNAVVPDAQGPVDWQIADGQLPAKKIRWSGELGFVSCGDPVIADGMVWVGTNNGREGTEGDASVLMCFRERDGKLLYKYVSPRLPRQSSSTDSGDWPITSLASSPLIERDRLWFCTNRCEVICMDIAPLKSGVGEPRIVWKVDMRRELGVVPAGVMIGSHASHCSITAYQDLIYVNTTNSARYDRIPAPESPSLVCFQKQTGAVRWKDNSPGKNILNCQHGSPLVIELMGRAQVIMGQGDGWVRGFDALTGESLWQFDINPKAAEPGYRHGPKFITRSDLVAMPVFHMNRVYFAVGRHLENCSGQGRVCCIDPSKRGDISSELDDGAGGGRPNPNSGLVWEYLGEGKSEEERMNRTLASVVIHKGLVIAVDASGFVHCLDARNGKPFWRHDTFAAIYSSPLIVGGSVYVANQDGKVSIFELAREKRLIATHSTNDAIESGLVYANSALFVMTRDTLYAIGEPAK